MAIACPAGRDAAGRVAYTHMSYQQLDQRSSWIAKGFESYGIGRGVRTVLMVRPGLELFSIAFALFKVGAVPVLIDPGIGRKHLKRCIANAEPEAFIGVPEAQLARFVLGWGRGLISKTVTVGRRTLLGGVTLASLEAMGRPGKASVMVDTGAEETAGIVFTSGSTGPPKGVVYQHGNFMAQVEALREMFQLEPGEVELPTFPLFALFDPALGMTTVVPDMDPTRPAQVDPRRIFEPIEDFGVTMMFGSPALLDTVGRYGSEHGVKLPTVKRVLSAGAPVSPQVIERFASLLPDDARILTPYGASESLPVAVNSSHEILSETRHATDAGAGTCVGRPVPSIELELIKVQDEPIPTWDSALAVPRGEIGEIVVKGPQVTRAYFNAEEHNRLGKIPDADGEIRHRMGDLGYQDEQGRLWFVGRKSHRVLTPDGPMDTTPCEAVFNTHPAVFRSALVGVDRGEGVEPVLCIELESETVKADRAELTAELLELGEGFDHTRSIRTVLIHPGFPVDIRHNAKIKRGQLAQWAKKKLRSRKVRK